MNAVPPLQGAERREAEDLDTRYDVAHSKSSQPP